MTTVSISCLCPPPYRDVRRTGDLVFEVDRYCPMHGDAPSARGVREAFFEEVERLRAERAAGQRFAGQNGVSCDTPMARPVGRGMVALQWQESATPEDIQHVVGVARSIAASCNVDVLLVPPGASWQRLPAVELAREALVVLEWAQETVFKGERVITCPRCGMEPERAAGVHYPNCLLDAALTALGLDTPEKRDKARAARRPS